MSNSSVTTGAILKSLKTSLDTCCGNLNEQHSTELVNNIQHALEHAKDTELLAILQLLQSKLQHNPTNNDFNTNDGRQCIAAIGWDLLHPLFPIATQSIHDNHHHNNSKEISQLATDLLRSIAQYGNPREIYMSLLERLGWITNDTKHMQSSSSSYDAKETDNDDDIDDNDKTGRKKREEQIVILDRCSKEIELAINLLIIVIPRIKTTRLWQFINDLCDVLDNTLGILGVLAHWEQSRCASKDNEHDTWSLLCSQRIVHVVLALVRVIHVHSCSEQTDDTDVYFLQDDPNYLRLLTVRLILLLIEKYTTQRSLGLSATIYYIYHPKYNIISNKDNGDEMRSRHIWLETMQQILTTSIECKLDVNQLLQYRLYQNDPINNNAKIDSPDVHRLKQFSIRGTLALLAYAIVTQQFSHTTICGCNDVQLNSLNLAGAPWIPCITTPRWLFAHMIYFAHQGTEGFSGQGDTTEETTADLALAALLPLLTLLGTDAFDSRHCERRICIQPTTLVQLVQTLATIASLSPHAQIRFVAYRTLAMTVTIAGITGEVRMLCNLLGHCPFPTMRAATVGLIREAVHRNMSITSMDNPFNSLQFWSVFGRLLFLPHGNILPSTILDCSSATWQQDRFMEYTDFIMHVLNFYIYLLLRDRVTQRLGVWKEEACQQVREQLLHPTRRCLEIILASSCKASTQHDATEYTPILSTLANALDRIDEIIS